MRRQSAERLSWHLSLSRRRQQRGRSTVKNCFAMLSRVTEQAVRDGIVDRNPARVTGWQREYQRAEDELDDPRSLALPDWKTLTLIAAALVDRSADGYAGWGDVVVFAACTAARIGEVAGVRARGIDRQSWTWTVRRQTTPSPGGLRQGHSGQARRASAADPGDPELVADRLDQAASPDSRLFVGPRRPDQHGGAARRDALGRGGDRTRIRAPAAARPAPYRPDLDGRRPGCRCTSYEGSPGTDRSPPPSDTCTRTDSRSTRPERR